MRLLKKLALIFRKPKQHLAAIDNAREFFQSISSQEDHRSMAKVIASTDDAYIVRLCFGRTKPPSRAYFKIHESGAIDELEFEQVRQYGERPWR